MNFFLVSLFYLNVIVIIAAAFVSKPKNVMYREKLSLFRSGIEDVELKGSRSDDIINCMKNGIAGTVLCSLLWSSPLVPSVSFGGDMNLLHNNVKSRPVIEVNWNGGIANAKEMASGTGSRVNKDPESLLRYGLPIKNKEVRKLQKVIETLKRDISSKRLSSALAGIKETKQLLKSDSSKYLESCRDTSLCKSITAQMSETLDPLDDAMKESEDSLRGSEQERTALDKAYQIHDKLQNMLTQLEEEMIPAGYYTAVPKIYSDLPQLRGRATVEMSFKKPDGQLFLVSGNKYKTGDIQMIIDGYSSPITAGNFVDLVQKGFYDNMPIQRSDGFVVQTGEPQGKAFGYVGTPSKSIGAGPNGERLIPNEITVVGDKAPFYESTVEDEGKGGQATVLPFSSYGAMGWARDEYDPNSGSSQFFWLLFDSDLTPAGKNVLDGRYPCFGYVVKGEDFLRDLKEEDIIISAKVTSGAQNLVQPQ